MASITTSVVLLRWPLVSAVLMFLASSLNIQLRKSDYAGLAVICSCLGLAAARQRKDELRGKRVGILLSGGNVDLARFCALLGG